MFSKDYFGEKAVTWRDVEVACVVAAMLFSLAIAADILSESSSKAFPVASSQGQMETVGPAWHGRDSFSFLAGTEEELYR